MDDVEVCPGVTIPAEELTFSFSRSGGPGGQHANTSDTKVELRFDVGASRALSEAQKERIRRVLGGRMTADGVLVLTASEHRSQTRNREAAVARFATLLAGALRPRRPRRATKPSRAAKERRLADKRARGQTKALRKPPDPT
jgi:ribosome-associated protein